MGRHPSRYVIAADGMWSSVRKAVKNGIEGTEVTGTLLGSIFNTGPTHNI